jgi:hypothetical protein
MKNNACICEQGGTYRAVQVANLGARTSKLPAVLCCRWARIFYRGYGCCLTAMSEEKALEKTAAYVRCIWSHANKHSADGEIRFVQNHGVACCLSYPQNEHSRTQRLHPSFTTKKRGLSVTLVQQQSTS